MPKTTRLRNRILKAAANCALPAFSAPAGTRDWSFDWQKPGHIIIT
jgi:hypothetical protein